MKRSILAAMLAGVLAVAAVTAQAPTPYKLGTFERQGQAFLGIVLRDSMVIDYAAADKAVPVRGTRVAVPGDMKDLISRYDQGVRARIVELVAAAAATPPPAYVHQLSAVRTLPPIMYPTTMLNAAVNYREHGAEIVQRDAKGAPPKAASAPGDALPGTQSAPGIWDRRAGDTRWNPYLFLKASSAVIGEGAAIRIPPGRTQIDWECEMGVVVGRMSTRVPIAQARQHIFGYTIEQDISDRGGRGDSRYGSDWFVGKSHDTFAPLGPFIVPKEFVPAIDKVAIRFTLNGQVMQDADTSLMIHNVDELLSYGSSVLTLRPGDVIATGSPAGVGSARTPPIFLKAGDRTVCTYDGIGTLTNPVVGS